MCGFWGLWFFSSTPSHFCPSRLHFSSRSLGTDASCGLRDLGTLIAGVISLLVGGGNFGYALLFPGKNVTPPLQEYFLFSVFVPLVVAGVITTFQVISKLGSARNSVDGLRSLADRTGGITSTTDRVASRQSP